MQPDENGNKPLLANTKTTKVTVGTLLTALVGGGGVLLQRGFDEVTRIENLVTQHEIRNEHQDKDIADLKAEIVQVRQFLVEKLEIRVPEQ